MDVYSPVLGVALACSGLSVAAAILSRAIGRDAVLADKWGRISRLLVGLSLIAAAVAAVSHVLYGHPPGTPDGMELADFIYGHPALLGVGVLAALGIWVSR